MTPIHALRTRCWHDYCAAVSYRRQHPGWKSDLAVDIAFATLKLLESEK